MTTEPLSMMMVELGCGSKKRNSESVGVDILPLPGVDVVSDALVFLRTLPNDSVSSIYSSHFMEHVDDAESIIVESSRVLVSGGEFRAVIPHFSNPAFYSDPTHRNYFGLYTFGYWVKSTPYRRKTPQYIAPLPFVMKRARHRFKSSPPFYFRHGLKKAVSAWVNMSVWTQEFYEEHWCWIMPCYEVEFVLQRE